MKLGVTGCDPADFRDQESRGGIGQLSHLLSEIEGRGDVGRHVFGTVISGERFSEGARAQFGQQTAVFTVGAANDS